MQINSENKLAVVISTLFLGMITLILLCDTSVAQQYIGGYTVQDVNPQGQQPLLFGVAAYKLCQIKGFLFAAVYIVAAIVFVIFAISALIGKFKLERFIPILAAVFIVASADLFIAWISPSAYYCPSTLGMFA